MKMTIKLVALLALIAITQAYVVINTYSDFECNEKALVAKYIVRAIFIRSRQILNGSA